MGLEYTDIDPEFSEAKTRLREILISAQEALDAEKYYRIPRELVRVQIRETLLGELQGEHPLLNEFEGIEDKYKWYHEEIDYANPLDEQGAESIVSLVERSLQIVRQLETEYHAKH